ncbi:MAG: site-2 protease family protein [Planctomycetaceae bacterium]|nr:site-2 protease family protein [Planctomycetaceae bacterium]
MPQQTPFDIRFTLFRIPISVGPFFWLVALIFCSDFRDGKLIAIGVFAFFLAILVHELGHALVIRYIFGASPWVVLHGFGGLTFHQPPYYYRTPRYAGRILISFAGPMAGFLLSFLCYFLAGHFGEETLGKYLYFLLGFLYIIGIFWGVINLLPVYPLDGGQICREICQWIGPRRGVRVSLYISAVTGIIAAMLGFLLFRSFFLPLLFGLLAYQSIQMLQMRRY